MLSLDIPNRDRLEIAHLILDFNGTIATDGLLIPGAVQRIEELASLVTVHVITADTNETARTQLTDVPCTLKIIGTDRQNQAKLAYATALGLQQAVAIGNGSNDLLMLQQVALGICLIQREGADTATLQAADIVCLDINDALDLLLKSHRLVATLRS